MIKCLNGGLVTLTASDEDIVPMERNAQGEYIPAGRTTFGFVVVAGTVKATVGNTTTNTEPDGMAYAGWTTAGDKFFLTASPELKDGSRSNIHASGAGASFNIFW